MPRSVIDLFACWWTSGRPRSDAIWKMVLICLFWCLWKEINNWCFENLERSLKDILSSFFFFFFFFFFFYGQWLLCPHCHLVLLIFSFVFLFLVR
jgi:hypothetical protein